MPRHATRTSFKPGYKRSPESIEKQRRTLQARGTHPVNEWSEETKAKHRATKRANALGNRRLEPRGNTTYWAVMTPDGYRYEHRVVMEAHIGRPLDTSEHVHHINHDGQDNRIENLELVSHSDHSRMHSDHLDPMGSKLKPGQWSRKYDSCQDCGTTERPHSAKGLCTTCYRRPYGRYRS